MKPRLPCLLWCVGWCVLPTTGQSAGKPADGALVHCGDEQVAIVEGTQSKDGHFAAGWTLRPKTKKPPVDWSSYHADNPDAFVAKFNPQGSVDFPDDGDYRLVNGVLDLAARTFTVLAGDAPYYPGEPHSELEAVWSEDRHGRRYGVVSSVFGTNHSEGTAGLWLVTLDASGVHVADIKPAADRAVGGFLRKRDPKDAADYQWTFGFENDAPDGGVPMTIFKGDKLTLHFVAQVPEEARNLDAGYVSFSLSKGAVTGITSDEPFRRAERR